MKKSLLILGLLVGNLLAGEINVAVAANVSYAMDELKSEFNRLHPETKVNVTLGSSGKLTAQIKNGAPFQIFLSANMAYPDALYAEGIAVTKPTIYAQGGLAYFSSKKYDFSKGIQLLKSVDISKIAIANPKTAPYGKAAIEAMKSGGVYEEVKDKFVFAESISQTVAYAIAAADIGFIAKSSLYSPKMAAYKEGLNWANVDTKLYTPIDQGIVILKDGQDSSEVEAFYTYILSDSAKKILNKFGYLVP